MSRNAVHVGRRAIQLHSPSPIVRSSSYTISPIASSALRLVRSRIPSSPSPLQTSVALHHVASPTACFALSRHAANQVRGVALWTTPSDMSRARQKLGTATLKWVMMQRRWNSDGKPPANNVAAEDNAPKQASSEQSNDNNAQATGAGGAGKYIYDHLPHFHRPSKEELLSAATGFWHRLSIRFKWFSIRSVRPFNHDEIFAFLSWIFWGHVLWLIIGTTTFVSLAIWALNTVFAQETLAGWVGNYLTKSSGIKIVFESAIVPKWGDGTIRLNKVFVSRRPATDKNQRAVMKGSSAIAAAAAAASYSHFETDKPAAELEPEDDGNYSQFDVTIESVELTLSFTKWFNGKGLLRDVEVRGVRGVVDRTFIKPRAGDENIDPKSYRHEHNVGDFEIEHFKMEDVLLTVYQPNKFRPFTVSVYNCELPRLRKQWLFYDFLSANNMSGSFDGSLFTIHPRQIHSGTGAMLIDGREDESSQWKKHSRIRIDGLKIDHLNRGVEGPFSWINDGNVDIVADVMIPHDADGSIAKVMSDFYDLMEATVTNHQLHNNQTIAAHHPDGGMIDSRENGRNQQQSQEDEDNRFLVMDIQIHLNDVRASVPIFTRDISYVNNAVVRPIVAYINSHARGGSNFIPITCRIVKRQSEFDGSWTIFDSGLLDDLSRETYDAFVRDITDRKARQRRMKKVGLWAAQVAAQALFIGLAGQLA